jgi:hypothetical protein
VATRRSLAARSWMLPVVAVGLALAVGQVLLAGLFSAGEATGHARYHAIFAFVVLAIAGSIVARWPAAGLASRAPALGFVALAAAQLVESIGAYGYDAANDARINGLAGIHDIGVLATAPGMILAALGVGLGLIVAASRLSGIARLVALPGAAVAAVGGLVLAKMMIGL